MHTYKDLFDGCLGKLPVKYKMTLTESATLVIRNTHRIPVAMQNKVKSEIDQMEKYGFISSVPEPTNWVSNLVAAKKKAKDDPCICLKPHD